MPKKEILETEITEPKRQASIRKLKAKILEDQLKRKAEEQFAYEDGLILINETISDEIEEKTEKLDFRANENESKQIENKIKVYSGFRLFFLLIYYLIRSTYRIYKYKLTEIMKRYKRIFVFLIAIITLTFILTNPSPKAFYYYSKGIGQYEEHSTYRKTNYFIFSIYVQINLNTEKQETYLGFLGNFWKKEETIFN
jgi:hypothetical protein